MTSDDALAILGLTAEATYSDVDRAYTRLSRFWSPRKDGYYDRAL